MEGHRCCLSDINIIWPPSPSTLWPGHLECLHVMLFLLLELCLATQSMPNGCPAPQTSPSGVISLLSTQPWAGLYTHGSSTQPMASTLGIDPYPKGKQKWPFARMINGPSSGSRTAVSNLHPQGTKTQSHILLLSSEPCFRAIELVHWVRGFLPSLTT